MCEPNTSNDQDCRETACSLGRRRGASPPEQHALFISHALRERSTRMEFKILKRRFVFQDQQKCAANRRTFDFDDGCVMAHTAVHAHGTHHAAIGCAVTSGSMGSTPGLRAGRVFSNELHSQPEKQHRPASRPIMANRSRPEIPSCWFR